MAPHDTHLRSLFIASFNADLIALGSPARVAATTDPLPSDMLALLDEDGECLALLPDSMAPAMVAAAYRLYRQGRMAGETEAWAKLRRLIGISS